MNWKRMELNCQDTTQFSINKNGKLNYPEGFASGALSWSVLDISLSKTTPENCRYLQRIGTFEILKKL